MRDNACESVVVCGARITRTFNQKYAREGDFGAASFGSDIRSFGVLSDDLAHRKGIPRINFVAGVRVKPPCSEAIPARVSQA
jgi:hypothetical protein